MYNGNIEGTTQTICSIGKDNYRYLTFHYDGNFHVGCNVNTTMVSFYIKCFSGSSDRCLLGLQYFGAFSSSRVAHVNSIHAHIDFFGDEVIFGSDCNLPSTKTR